MILETHAINLCNQYNDHLDVQELKIVIKLYTQIFQSRSLRSMVDDAINVGFIALRLAKATKSLELELKIFPGLIRLLSAKMRYGQVASMLEDLGEDLIFVSD